MPTILTIAGSDPTGGAGVQADLQVCCSLRAHGAAVVTAITIQNTRGVCATHPIPASVVEYQLTYLLDDTRVDGVKTGMLVTAQTVEVVAEVLARHNIAPVVVDPVLFSTSGAPLLDAAGLSALKLRLWPLATLVTPNLLEAGALSGMEVDSVEKMRACARRLADMGPGAVLVKGGHLSGDPVDVLCVGHQIQELPSVRIAPNVPVHGTGCALASATAVFLAEGLEVSEAVSMAKTYVAAGIAAAKPIGRGAAVLDYQAGARAIGR